MARPDGRIQAGQSLDSAISARAWNRMQDATDLVMSKRFQFTSAQPQRQLHYATLRVPVGGVDGIEWPDGQALSVGHAIGLPGITTTPAMRDNLNVEEANDDTQEVLSEDDLSPPLLNRRWIQSGGLNLGESQFGVISSLTRNDNEGFYYITAIVGGVFVTRCLALAPCDHLIGPISVPQNAELKSLWRPYPLMVPSGPARVLAVGAYYKLSDKELKWQRKLLTL